MADNERTLIGIILLFLIGASSCFALEDQRGAFVQTGEELHFFVDTNQYWTESITSQLLADARPSRADSRSSRPPDVDHPTRRPSSSENNSHRSVDRSVDGASGALNQLMFEPPTLDFGTQAVGVPEQKKVTVTNPTASKVRFDAISGSTVHFHCSFFDEKTIEPGSSTTFDVIFLPRQEGVLNNALSIHSSLGAFQYVVSGVGTSNAYRLRPFVGARVPLNGTFIGTLEMHNPHPTTLRVVEMYTSGGDLHVDLPVKGRGDGVPAKSVWEIPPYQTRTVARARYVGGRVKNATAYIRIKTDRDYGSDTSVDRRQEALIVPVEVEVTAKAGLYAAVDRLDFGTIVEGEQSKWAILEIYNTHNHTVEITSVESDSQLLRIDFRPVVSLTSSSRTPSYVAKFSYHASAGEERGKRIRSGRIVLKSKHGKYALNVPYSVQVLEGRLVHDPSQVASYKWHHQSQSIQRNITLWNGFDSPLVIYNVTLPKNMRKLFKIQNFSTPIVIPSQSSRHVVTLSHALDADLNVVQSNSRLRVHTNISRCDIPLYLFDGMLRFTLYSIDQKEFNFGIMDAGQERFILFAVTNENPIPVTIQNLTNALPAYTTLHLLGVEEGNHSVLSYDHSPSEYQWKSGEDFTLPARSFAVFRFSVMAPVQSTVYRGRMVFRTAFQITEYPITFSVEEGDMISVPEKVVIDDAFPGKISSHALQVYNTFSRDMPLLRLSTLSNDPRFFFESFDKQQSPVIEQGKVSRLGRLFFMPVASCLDDCYVGLPLYGEDGYHWITGMRLPSELPEIDMYLYRKLRSKWEAIVERGEDVVNSTIMVDTTHVKNFPITAQGRLVWPRLMKQSSVHFPLTAVGNYTIVNVTLQNPSSLPVAVQLLPLTIYPGPYDLVKMLDKDLDAPLTSYVEVDDVLIFSLRDSELYNAKPESPVPRLRQELERAVGIQIPRFTLSMLLQPGMKVRVRIGFLPPDYQLRSTLLLIRNNLTILETTTLYGRGGKLELRIGSKLPNSKQPLLLEVPDKYLKECENLKRQQHRMLTHLTVRRSFVVRNSGELPLHISNMSISGQPCYARGFRILNCEPFRIQPNATHVLDIAFTPDFTISWFEASLQLYISGAAAPLHYAIGASVPKEWLAKCQSALPRPYWEPLMYYSCVVALGFLLICVIASAYLEGDRIITCAFKQQLCSYRRRMYELEGNARPFSFRQSGYDNEPTNGLAVGDGYENVFEGTDNGLDQNSPSEKPRSLPYRLMMLFYYLITKRYVQSTKNDDDDNQSPSTNSKVSTARIVVSGRTVRTTMSVSSHKHQEGSGQEGKLRRNTDSAECNLSVDRKADRSSSPRVMAKSQVGRAAQQAQRMTNTKNTRKRQPHSISGTHNDNGIVKGEDLSSKEYEGSTKCDPPTEIVTRAEVQQKNQETNPVRRRLPYLENRKSEGDSRRKTSTDRTPLANRSSREISESEADDRGSKYKNNDKKGRKVSFGKGVLPPRVEEGRPVTSIMATPASYTSKLADNKATTAIMKKTEQKKNPDETSSRSMQFLAPPPASNCGRSDSEESAIPEWDRSSLSGGVEQMNTDEAFDKLAKETSSFASGVMATSSNGNRKSTHSTPGRNGSVDRERLTVATESKPELPPEGNHPSPTLLSPIGNESIISSTSRSDSTSSLEASASSSPSPDERNRTKMKPIGSAEPIQGKKVAVDNVQRKKKGSASGGASFGIIGGRDHKGHKPTGEKNQPGLKQSSAAPIGQQSVIGSQRPIGTRSHQENTTTSTTTGKSIMQQLREERMRRLQEHYQRKAQGEEWPGFERQSVGESLWDDDYDPWKGLNERRQMDIWSQPNWTGVNVAPTEQPRGTESPFPSLFDFPVVPRNTNWSNSPELNEHVDASMNLSGLGQGQSTRVTTGVQNFTPPPPPDSSIVAWGPPVSTTNTWSTQNMLTAEDGRDQTEARIQSSSSPSASWNTGSVMTGVDIMWPHNLLHDE